jgi:predicted dehydrogenase
MSLSGAVVIDGSGRTPRREKSRGRIGLGLIGAGAVWERRYHPVIDRFAQRMAIRAVYDPIPARAQLAGAALQADAAGSLRQLFERTDLAGVLVLDPEWLGLVPAELACQHRKPAFLAGSLGDCLTSLRNLYRLSQEHNVLLMTEFSRRHTPATNRIRELTATRLGGVRRITVSAQLPPEDSPEALPGQKLRTDVLVGLLDWCVYLSGRVPAVILATPLDRHQTAAGYRIQLGFRRGAHDAAGISAEIQIQNTLPAGETPAAAWQHSVECEHGLVTTGDPFQVAWKNGEQEARESLTSDRLEAEVMLDKFCRRVVGGVIPTADVLDVCRALTLAQAAEHSLASGQPVHAPWEF